MSDLSHTEAKARVLFERYTRVYNVGSKKTWVDADLEERKCWMVIAGLPGTRDLVPPKVRP